MSYNNAPVPFEDRVNLVVSNEGLFSESLTSSDVVWEKEKQYAIQLLQGNDFLASIATQSPASIQNAIINVANIGISLSPALKHAYLVPRKVNKKMAVCLDISYMGLMHLAQSSGVILWGQSKIVHANDDFELQGLSKEPLHKFNPFGDRGAVVGVYCTVKTVDGDFLTDVMTIKEVHDIRDRSESFKKKSGPWISDEGEMIRKTVVKRAYKYWPKCERLSEATKLLNDGGEGFVNEVVEISQDTYEQERYESLNQVAVDCASVCSQMETINELSSLEGVYKAMARKIKDVGADNLMIGLIRSKDANKSRIEGMQNDTAI